MREILFKAKRIDDGEWVEGYLMNDDCGCFIMPEDYISERQLKNNHYGYELVLIKAYEVDFETICQYTGLTDKNGNKIWENDIFKHYNRTLMEDFKSYVIGSVIWDESHCRFTNYDSIKNEYYCMNDTCVYEIIGNIFDNPELLGV